MMARIFVAGMLAGGLALAGCGSPADQVAPEADSASSAGPVVPQFRYDKAWPKPLPNNWKMGQVVGISVDSRNHIWITQRPGTLKNSEREAFDGSYGGMRGAVAGCCRPAAPVIEFDQVGNMVQGYGGPNDTFDWPTAAPKGIDNQLGGAPFGERGIHVDAQDNVWLGADGHGDGQVLKLSRFGRKIMQFGKPNQAGPDSNDQMNARGAAGVVVDVKANEAYIADGLHNRRVLVIDATTGKYLRHWGAYGKPPDDAFTIEPDSPDPDSPQFGDVHCINQSDDMLLYVCDRVNNRIQVFKTDGTFVKQGEIAPGTKGGAAYGIAFSRDTDQKHAYVVDGMNEKVWILDRESLETVGSFGFGSHAGGGFTEAFSIATDLQGNVYVGEAWEGKRVQRFRLQVAD
jgi:hypothetical protein